VTAADFLHSLSVAFTPPSAELQTKLNITYNVSDFGQTGPIQSSFLPTSGQRHVRKIPFSLPGLTCIRSPMERMEKFRHPGPTRRCQWRCIRTHLGSSILRPKATDTIVCQDRTLRAVCKPLKLPFIDRLSRQFYHLLE
jgi:hypothetical protein